MTLSMRNWNKRAVPLIFTEVCMNAIRANSTKDARVEKIRERIEKWVDRCWDQLRERQLTDKELRAVGRKHDRLHTILKSFWRQHPMTPTQLTNTMLAVVAHAEEVYVAEQNRHSWQWLSVALDDLTLFFDPERQSTDDQDEAIELSRKIIEEAEE